jgi:hypothetical protein
MENKIMLRRRLFSNGGYLMLEFFITNSKIPLLYLDSKGIIGSFLVSPFLGVSRILFWTIYEKLPDGYDVWCLRKNTYSNDDMNKAVEYFKGIHSFLTYGWSTWNVCFSNTIIIEGLSPIHAGRIWIGGIRRIGINDSCATELLHKIDILTEYYVTSICVT